MLFSVLQYYIFNKLQGDIMKKRDNSIDILRGIAVFAIIIIHTTFWSGESYVPDIVRSLSLLIAVTLFIFIPGMIFNFNNSVTKTVKGLINIWKKYLIFLIPFFIYQLIIDKSLITMENLLASLFFILPVNSALFVVPGSFWFVFMYVIVSMLCSIIITIYNKHNKNLDNFIYIIILSFILYGISLFRNNFIFLNSNTLLYTFIFLLGYYLYNKKIKNFKSFLVVLIPTIIITIAVIKFGWYGIDNIQGAKNVSSITYFCFSMISIIVAAYLKDRIKFSIKPLEFIGQNAIIYYFAQGVGSSLIYKFLPYINLNWVFKLPIMIIINIILTLMFGYILYKFTNLCLSIIDKIKINNILEDK